ncbi:MAG: extracellular solute-binding protein [Chloroflexi bacterium]|nr:extracellular solute-binding protein [Chloroflexota bacterium]
MFDTNKPRSYLSRRQFLRVAGLASGALLAACVAPPAATPAPQAGEATVAPQTPSSAGGGEVALLWSDINSTQQPMIEDFTKATGIKVNQTVVQYNERLNKINTAVQGGGGFDVVQMDTIWTAQFVAAGWVEDISDRLTDAIKKDVPDSSISAVRVGGKIYGMPFFNSAKHLFYNEKLLKDAGIDKPAATLDEFMEQAKATTDKDKSLWGSVWSWKQSEALICDWVAIMFTKAGAQILDDSGKAVFNTMGGVEALQWMVDLLNTHKVADPASLEFTEDDVRKALMTGNYALTYNWEGVLPDANDPKQSKAAPNVHVGLLPGSQDVKSSSVNGSEGWAILNIAKNKDNAWKLLEYMASVAWQKKAMLIAGQYPILSSLYSDPDLQKNVTDFPIYGEQFKYLAVRPQVPSYTQASDIIQKHLHEALLGQVKPQEAMDAAADEVNKLSTAP